MPTFWNEYENCTLCPRKCKANREAGEKGICQVTSELYLARAALHYWEEPCISGSSGSGAVFFSGCNMHCVFCQNKEIADGTIGKCIPPERLAEIFLELEAKNANNINLVTATHYVPHVVYAVEEARRQGLRIPIVYNTSGYETVDNLKRLEGIVDIYLPDYKYVSEESARKYSKAADYSRIIDQALEEMVRQKPKASFYKKEGEQLMAEGVIVRHLLLPGQLYAAKTLLKKLYDTYGNQIFYSLMSQYTPLPHVKDYEELTERVTKEAYDNLVDYAVRLGIQNGFTQDLDVAEESFIPHFDYEGV